MPSPMTAPDVLNREFLELRAKVLELAASFDRLGRSSGDVAEDRRMQLIRQAIDILQSSQDDKAERVQLLFSRAYSENWRQELAVRKPR